MDTDKKNEGSTAAESREKPNEQVLLPTEAEVIKVKKEMLGFIARKVREPRNNGTGEDRRKSRSPAKRVKAKAALGLVAKQ